VCDIQAVTVIIIIVIQAELQENW